MHNVFITSNLPGRTVVLNNVSWLYFSGTSYLGMSQHPDFHRLLAEGIQRYGANFGGSRRSNLRLQVYEQAEQYLATYTGAEAALTVSSGTLAGQLAVQILSGAGKFYFAPGVHPALFGEGDYTTSDYDTWVGFILEQVWRHKTPIVLFSNALDPLRVRAFDFSWLWQLPSETPLTLVLDDSHGIGVRGRAGAGIHTTLNLPPQVELLVVASLGKAMAIPGGMLLGRHERIKAAWQHPFFGGASPAVPAYLHAMLQAAPLYEAARQILFRHIEALQIATQPLKLFQTMQAYPVFYTTENALVPFLQQHRMLISSFPYPSPEDPLLTRLIVSAAHTSEDIALLIRLLKMF
ncbi:MAG TPA: aminotransferase class I/II-fold pyridoxal phosphate-dependent enzyme [Saprospiraceae bacterium]|nr:aminotransferase class I/II-fold pyridoxal phosphate-dependent enzyme [Saprospiraceae bacterium]HMP14978.1 aminotransferase class I/II-fold pyridoxal phosphate-dependent enzyme [Saprospiraceae bacterium]